ncbi:MAG: hypothetical protein DVB22_002575 [Verrucomicrobia bacterium]|nr:MAG: hypothetical protein DVB22_002575 [Verrucomicrobiota bacterium]
MRDYIIKQRSDARRSASAPDAPAPEPRPERAYPDTRHQPLSASEVKELGIASAAAFKKWGADPANDADRLRARTGLNKTAFAAAWRHNEVTEATEGRAEGLRGVSRADYRRVKAHFLNIAGLTEQAFAEMLGTGTVKGEPVENGEQVDRAIATVLAQMARHFRESGQDDPEGRAKAYLSGMASAKERAMGCGWRSWPSKSRWQLYFTLRNRLHAMTGVGDPAKRNKSQRAK